MSGEEKVSDSKLAGRPWVTVNTVQYTYLTDPLILSPMGGRNSTRGAHCICMLREVHFQKIDLFFL